MSLNKRNSGTACGVDGRVDGLTEGQRDHQSHSVLNPGPHTQLRRVMDSKHTPTRAADRKRPSQSCSH